MTNYFRMNMRCVFLLRNSGYFLGQPDSHKTAKRTGVMQPTLLSVAENAYRPHHGVMEATGVRFCGVSQSLGC